MSAAIHICWGGPVVKLPKAHGGERDWELHRMFGPIPLKRNGDPLSVDSLIRIPTSEWSAASKKWAETYPRKEVTP